MSDNRPSTYLEDGRRVYRASSFGGCLKALVAARDGLEPVPFPASLRKAMEDSGNLETQVFSRLGLVRAQQLEVQLKMGDFLVRGHIDGLFEDRVVEVKVLGEHYWNLHKAGKLHEAMPQYPWQLSVYMLALNMKGLWAIGHKVEGVLLDVDLVEVDEPYFTFADVRERVAAIEAANFEPCAGDQWPCAYPYIHVDPIEESDDGDLRLLVDAYRRAKEAEENWADQKSGYRAEIIKLMNGRPKVGIGPYRVSHSTSTRRTLDLPRLKEVIDVSPFEKTTETEQLRITLRGE